MQGLDFFGSCLLTYYKPATKLTNEQMLLLDAPSHFHSSRAMYISDLCQLGQDDRFGPFVDGCRDGFDFTLLFEQTILSMLPDMLFLIVAIVRVVRLHKMTVKTLPNILGAIKLVCAVSFNWVSPTYRP
jgi:hypothetical protein